MSGRTEPLPLERAIWNMLARAADNGHARPAIVLLNTVTAVSVDNPKHSQCLTQPTTCDTLCADGTPDAFDGIVDGEMYRIDYHSNEHRAAQLAHYYGLSIISHRQMLHALRRDGVHFRKGWSYCWMMSRLLRDFIHPTNLGNVLYADYFTSLLQLAEQHAARYPDVAAPGVPAKPLYPGGHDSEVTSCLFVEGTVLDPGRIRILESTGWQHISIYQSKAGTRFKPGLQASGSGAVLRFELDVTLPPGPLGERISSTQLLVTYLQSYEGMGMAVLNCEGGCRCDEVRLDGMHPQPARRESVHAQHALRLTGDSVGRVCQLRIETLPPSALQSSELGPQQTEQVQAQVQGRFKVLAVVVAGTPAAQRKGVVFALAGS